MTILEEFKELLKTKSIIESLEILGNKIEGTDLSLQDEEEIVEFGDYFVDFYEDKTYNERIKYFGESDAFILCLYDEIIERIDNESDFLEDCEAALLNVSMDERKELEKTFENLMHYPGTKNIFCQFNSGYNFSCEIDEELDNDQVFELKSIIAKALKSRAVFLIELIDKKIVTGLYFEDGKSLTIIKTGLKKMHNIDFETGAKIKQKGYKYIEANELLTNILKGDI